MEDAVLDDEEEAVETPKRRGPPRFGSFITIAAAILLLFGAASRVGKVEETLSLFGIDHMADQQRIRREEERLRTAITLGAVPVQRDELRPHSGSVPVRSNVQPPYRGEIDPDDVRGSARTNLSGVVLDTRHADNPSDAQDERSYWNRTPDSYVPPRNNVASLAIPAPTQSATPAAGQARPETYVVANGDTWNKIAMKTLGDANRWQEIRAANPNSHSGLSIGMKLVIPHGSSSGRSG